MNPGIEDSLSALSPGLLLFDSKTGLYSFVPLAEEELWVDHVFFSPGGGKTMVVSSRQSRFFSQLAVYDTGTLARLAAFTGGDEAYFVDGERFAFTLREEEIERPETAGLWGKSAVLYDPGASGGVAALRKASDLQDFNVTGFAGGNVQISVTSVPSAPDWSDPDKWEETVMEFPPPPPAS